MAIKQIKKIKVKTMPHDQPYLQAENKIEEALKLGAPELDLSSMGLTKLPNLLGKLTQLQSLNLYQNKLSKLPGWFSSLKLIKALHISDNEFTKLPKVLQSIDSLVDLDFSDNPLQSIPNWICNIRLERLVLSYSQVRLIPEKDIGKIETLKYLLIDGESEVKVGSNKLPSWIRSLRHLTFLRATHCNLSELPHWLSELEALDGLWVDNNLLTGLPTSLAVLDLKQLTLFNNPLNPELAEAYKQGVEAVKLYLRAGAVVRSYEAKLILVGEGEVGKTSLLSALRDEPFVEGLSTTHGIEIKSVNLTDTDTQIEISINGWDFGGQPVYRPTHQLFFSAPAVYLVVWKPREGPQQGFVKEWIKLVKHREPSAKILVVATHGGPQQRQPDIDRQELWDLFGKDTVVDFFFVDNKPDEHDQRRGIEELKRAIARLAAELPEVGRSVPKSFADVRAALQERNVPYLPLDEVLAICRTHNMDDEIARLFITISHRLGHLTHYENDPQLRDIVILRPDWLATAMSYVLDDEETRKAHGLVKFSRLNHLWDDPTREVDSRYPRTLHPIFLRLMERFDLSYRVADPSPKSDSDPQSLIAQLVPDNRPDNFATSWLESPSTGDIQQTQICRIVDEKGNTATAEGLFYQLIVRLHKYSLGRADYKDSVHWQKGLVVDNGYNGRAFLQLKDNNVHITVRAAFPYGFLTMLTEEVRYLVESFWEGLRCEVTVPCLNPNPCNGLFEVSKLIENKKRGRPEQPCPVCNEWQSIEDLLSNAPASQAVPVGETLASQPVLAQLSELRQILIQRTDAMTDTMVGRFDMLDASQRELLSKAETSYKSLLQAFTDEAKEGPRLFSMHPVDPNWLEKPKQLVSQKFRIHLWCEHSELPLFVLNKEGDSRGSYDIDLPFEWVVKAAPYLKAVTATLSLILPVASSTTKLLMSDEQYKSVEKQLAFGKDVFDSLLKRSDRLANWEDQSDTLNLPHGAVQRAEGALLREFHAFLKEKDPGFGGLVRVMNKRQEFLWVHEKFAGEY